LNKSFAKRLRETAFGANVLEFVAFFFFGARRVRIRDTHIPKVSSGSTMLKGVPTVVCSASPDSRISTLSFSPGANEESCTIPLKVIPWGASESGTGSCATAATLNIASNKAKISI
jgi:hypothetical protein